MADENKTPEEEIFETYLQDANFTEEQKTAVLDALIEVGKRRNNPDYKAPEGKSVEEDVLDDYLKNNELSDEQVSTVLNAMISAERQRLTREAAEISENLDNLSAEELESLASNWARTPGADELRAKIAARQEELRTNAGTTLNDTEQQPAPDPNDPGSFNLDNIGNDTDTVFADDEENTSVEAVETRADNNQAAETSKPAMSQEDAYKAVDSGQYASMKPSELAAVRQALLTDPTAETTAAASKLDDHIVSQAGKYANDELALTDMNDVYALNDLLTSVRDQSNNDNAKSEEGKTILNAAIEKSGAEIQNFEEQYGFDKDHLQSPQIVESNIAKLDGLPQDKDIFALDVHEEKMQPPTEYQDVVEILNTARETGNAPELSVLTGALQCNGITEDQKKTLLELAERRVNDTKSLSFGDFKNFEYLLTALKESPNADKLASTLKKKEKLLSDARQAYAKSLPLKNKEFQDIYNVLSSLKVNGKLKAFGREQLDQGGMDSDIAMFLDQTRRETEMYLANTGKTVTPEAFNQEYATRLRNNLVEVVYADQFSKGKNSKEDYAAMFDQLAAAAQSKKGININQDSFIGWQAARTNRIETAVNKLGQKQGYENASNSFGERVQTTDQKLTQKYGKTYSMLKGCLKSAGWGAAYSIAGAAFGPAGIAAVATASFANQAYGFIKNFKKEREAAKAKGEKPASFWQYIKKNKLRTAGLLLSGATAAIGIGGVGGNAAVQIARSAAGIGLAASGAIHQAAQAYKSTQGSKGKKTWKAIQTALFSGASFYAGMLAGREAGEIASEAFADVSAATPVDHAGINGTNNESSVMDNPTMSDTPTIDVNNLSAEQQHDLKMLFLRDPAEANQILGQGGEQWMNSRELQEAWDNGTLTPEQKAQLVEFSGQRFDDHGNFQDVEGYKTSAQMEAEAKEWTAAQNAKAEAAQEAGQNNPDTQPRARIEPIEIESINPLGDMLDKMQAETLQQAELRMKDIRIPTHEQQPDVEINKININDDKIKIVGHDDDGRFVERTSADTLQKMPDDLDYNKIKFHDNGDISIRIDTDTGHQVNATIDKDGHYQSITSGSHHYSKEELDYVNNNLDNNQEALARNQERYNALQEMRNATEQSLSEQRAPTQEAPVQETPAQEAPVQETPAQEAPTQEAPVQETPAQEAPAQEAPVQETPAQETPAQEAPVQETPAQEAPVQETPVQETPVQEAPVQEAPVQETPVQETPVQEAPVQETPVQEAPVQAENNVSHKTDSNIEYSISLNEDGSVKMSFSTTLGYGTEFNEIRTDVNSQLDMVQQENGSYRYGLGESPDMNMAQKIHNLNLQKAYINHEILEDLNTRGDNLTSAESAAKEICLKNEEAYAKLGLSFDENGKPVLDDRLLNSEALEARNAERVAEAEQKLNMEDVSVQQARGGDIKISGEINGQNIEGRLNENGEFEKLSIDGQKIKGNDLAQYNEENKINNQALHNSAADKIAELRGLKQDSSTPAPAKGDRVMINDAQLNTTKGGRE